MHRLRRLRRHLPQRSHHRSLSFSDNTRDWNRAWYCTGLCPFCLYTGTWLTPNHRIKTDQSLWLFKGSIITGPFLRTGCRFSPSRAQIRSFLLTVCRFSPSRAQIRSFLRTAGRFLPFRAQYRPLLRTGCRFLPFRAQIRPYLRTVCRFSPFRAQYRPLLRTE